MYKILYVEDEEFLAKIVKESLERLGHEVNHVSNGGHALSAYQNALPDICILDVMLPIKNGFEIAKEIRNINDSVPILFLTAKSQTSDLVEGFQSGGNDYVKKPFSIEELQARIINLMEITSGKSTSKKESIEISIGEHYVFYPKKQQLVFDESIESLSHKESQILQLLASNINSSTERKEVLMKVWGDDSYFNSRNLDVYIRKIRKCLDKDEKVRILTLKGIGYHFVVE